MIIARHLKVLAGPNKHTRREWLTPSVSSPSAAEALKVTTQPDEREELREYTSIFRAS